MLTITNLVCRVVMATLLGFYTIVEIPLSLFVSFGILNLTVKNDQGGTTSETGKQEEGTSELEKSEQKKSETDYTNEKKPKDATSEANEAEETKVTFENEKNPPLQEIDQPRNTGVDPTANSASIVENVVEEIKDTKEPEASTTEN